MELLHYYSYSSLTRATRWLDSGYAPDSVEHNHVKARDSPFRDFRDVPSVPCSTGSPADVRDAKASRSELDERFL